MNRPLILLLLCPLLAWADGWDTQYDYPTNTLIIESFEGGPLTVFKPYGKYVKSGPSGAAVSYGTNQQARLITADASLTVTNDHSYGGKYALRAECFPTGSSGNLAYMNIGYGSSQVPWLWPTNMWFTNYAGTAGLWFVDTWFKLRLMILGDTEMADGQSSALMTVQDSGGSGKAAIIVLSKSEGVLNLYADDSVAASTLLGPIQTNDWQDIQIHCKTNSSLTHYDVSYWWNGTNVLNYTNINFTRTMHQLYMGLVYGTSATNYNPVIYFDDLQIFNDEGYSPTFEPVEVSLYCPYLYSRRGVDPLVVVSASSLDGLGYKCYLTNSAGSTSNTLSGAVLTERATRLHLDLNSSGADDWCLVVDITNDTGVVATDAKYFTRTRTDWNSHATIGTNNVIWVDGEPRITVGEFGFYWTTATADKAKTNWAAQAAINTLTGVGYDTPGSGTYADWTNKWATVLDSATNAPYEMGVWGPTAGWGSSLTTDPSLTLPRLTEWVDLAKDKDALEGWFFCDEPEGYWSVWDMHRWLMCVATNDPQQRPVELNFIPNATYSLNQSASVWVYAQIMNFPQQIADILGTDIYPIKEKYRYDYGYHEPLGAIYEGIKNVRMFNCDLVPTRIFIATTESSDAHAGYDPQPIDYPNPTQVKCMAWLALVAGARSVHWYGWQQTTSNAVIQACSNFVADVETYGSVLLSAEHIATASYTEGQQEGWPRLLTTDQEGPVFVSGRHENGTNWVIAVNTHSNSVTTTITDSSWSASYARSLFNRQTYATTENAWSVTLEPYAVEMFREQSTMNDAVLQPTGTGNYTISGSGSGTVIISAE